MSESKKRDITVYMVTHGPECYIVPDYVVPIEAGAALRDQFLYELRDDSFADNISAKNKDWCELTALYWIWKHDKSDITGLYHYRRVFMTNTETIKKALDNNDVIACETVLRASLKTMYNERCPSGSYDIIMDVIKRKYPNHYNDAVQYFSNNVYYNCQMIIAKRKWFDSYCEWLFDFCDSVEKSIPKECIDPRYMGYVAEFILGFYILITDSKVYGMNICHLSLDNSLYNRFRKTRLYSSHFMNVIKMKVTKLLR